MGKIASALIFKNKKEQLKDIPLSFFDLSGKDIDGNQFEFKNLKNKHKAFLCVNVASFWGLTKKNY